MSSFARLIRYAGPPSLRHGRGRTKTDTNQRNIYIVYTKDGSGRVRGYYFNKAFAAWRYRRYFPLSDYHNSVDETIAAAVAEREFCDKYRMKILGQMQVLVLQGGRSAAQAWKGRKRKEVGIADAVRMVREREGKVEVRRVEMERMLEMMRR